MARTLIQATLNTLATTGASSPQLDATFTPADPVSFNMFTATGRDILVIWNSDTNPHTFTLHSAPDAAGRIADVVNYPVLAGAYAQVIIPASALFTQTDGNVYIDADSALVKFLLTH
jgi:hypothetical protein